MIVLWSLELVRILLPSGENWGEANISLYSFISYNGFPDATFKILAVLSQEEVTIVFSSVEKSADLTELPCILRFCNIFPIDTSHISMVL